MEENFNENNEVIESPSRGKRFRAWLDNFMYHYKWHTIIAAFLVFTVTICSVQMCEKEAYDVFIVYAGGYDVSKIKLDENEPEYVTLTRTLGSIASDYNEDGEIKVSLDTLYMLTSKEIAEKNAELREQGKNEEVQTGTISANYDTMDLKMLQSEYYVCLMSEEIFKYYAKKQEGLFTDLKKYVEEDTEIEYFGDDTRAIYLSSTGMKNLPVLKNLPDDTLIVLRSLSEVQTSFREHYLRSEKYISRMINK